RCERARSLQVFTLEKDFAAGDFVERAGSDNRRAMNATDNAFSGLVDKIEIEHSVGPFSERILRCRILSPGRLPIEKDISCHKSAPDYRMDLPRRGTHATPPSSIKCKSFPALRKET